MAPDDDAPSKDDEDDFPAEIAPEPLEEAKAEVAIAEAETELPPDLDEPDPEAAGMPLVTQRKDGIDLNVTLSNSFGFGGTNACLVFKRYDA